MAGETAEKANAAELTDDEAADLVSDVLDSADFTLTGQECKRLETVERYLREEA